jgi:hypothetical protein
MLVGGLRMLLRDIRMFLTLGMVALAVMFSCGSMCLGSVFVMFGRLVVLISCHCKPRWLSAPSFEQRLRPPNVPDVLK